MPRRLLNIASIVCVVVCVALTALWARSYYWYGELRGRLTENDVFVIGVPSGRMRLTMLEPKFTPSGIPMRYHWPWAIANQPAIVFDKSPVGHGYLAWLGFDLDSNAQFSTVTIPLWFVALMFGASAALFRLRWPPTIHPSQPVPGDDVSGRRAGNDRLAGSCVDREVT